MLFVYILIESPPFQINLQATCLLYSNMLPTGLQEQESLCYNVLYPSKVELTGRLMPLVSY